MPEQVEQTILRSLLYNDDYVRDILPYLKPDYFVDAVERNIFIQIKDFIDKYNNLPSKDAIEIAIGNQNNLREDTYNRSIEILENLEKKQNNKDNPDWLKDVTEQFCKDKAMYNALMDAVQIADGKAKGTSNNAIPKILEDALAVSFEINIGHDYLEDAEKRYDKYKLKENGVPFDISFFNKITKNGFKDKTLNVFLAGPGIGKTLVMCHIAANAMMIGKNVLYITCEIAEDTGIGERIDANLFNVDIETIDKLPKKLYMSKIAELKKKITGKLIIKEYPTSTAHCGHFKHLLKELRLKKNFVPDIIFIDYINICASSRLKLDSQGGTYSYIKAIAEEMRGMAVEYEVPVVTATQVNRGGWDNSDVGLENTAESFGLPATADFMAALIQNENLESLDQMMVKQLKNRYRDKGKDTKFLIGVKKKYMKLYDVEAVAQTGIVNTGQTPEPKEEALENYLNTKEPKPVDKDFFKQTKKSEKFEGWKV